VNPILAGLVRRTRRRPDQRSTGAAERLRTVPEEDLPAVVLDLVRTHAAAALGHESKDAVDPARTLTEMGLDSLGAVELRNGIAEATGLRLSATVAFDNPSPAALADYLAARLVERRADPGADADGPRSQDTLTRLLRFAAADGTLPAAIPMLVEASRFQPRFEVWDGAPLAVTLTGEASPPHLFCLPSFIAGGGPHQFARFAKGMDGAHPVTALSLPGFREGEPAPASWDAVIDSLAATIREAAGEEEFAVVGYSIGGALAHALAERLEADGPAPIALAMIDTYAPRSEELGTTFASVMGEVLGLGHDYLEIADANLMAMGAYMRVYTEWEPGSVSVPALLVRADEPIGDAFERDALPAWQLPEDVVEVPGDHFHIVEAGAAATALAVATWLGEVALRADANA
jgi:thioesterase domain-containing protein/acyl carrier protein